MTPSKCKFIIILFITVLKGVSPFSIFNLFQYIEDGSRSFVRTQLPEEATMNFIELGSMYGLEVEKHQVITEDGYILTLFHLNGNENGAPTLLMHGILDTSDTYIIRGNNSIAVKLQKTGLDLWFGNSRGNKYSRKHQVLNPDQDYKFWDYSFNEIGYYDYPAMIDFIIERTKRKKVNVIAHSQGTSACFVMGATRPEYNDKVNVYVALAPVAYITHVKGPLKFIMDIGDDVNSLLEILGQEEVVNDRSIIKSLLTMLCINRMLNYEVCEKGMMESIAGVNYKQFEPGFLNVLFGHYPSSTSRKSLHHFVQVSHNDRFAKYDYGEAKNMEIYSSSKPPLYNLSSVTMNVALFYGRNDLITPKEDVIRLSNELSNLVYLRELESFNHIDFVWGRDIKKRLLSKIFYIIDKFS